MIIRNFNKQISTINLIFVIKEISYRLVSYNINLVLESSSNYYLIFNILYLETKLQVVYSRRSWKKIDINKIIIKA